MHSGLPFADATVTRCSPQRATARPPPECNAHDSPPERLRRAWPLLGSFPCCSDTSSRGAPSERTHVRPVCWAAAWAFFCQRPCKTVRTGRPRSAVALACRVEHGSCLPVAGQDLELLCAASCASDEAASEPTGGVKARVVAASAPPIGRLGTTMRTPFAFNHQCAQWESWSCTAWQDLCVGVHGGLGLGGGFGGVADARVAICVRALLGGAWRGSAPEDGGRGHTLALGAAKGVSASGRVCTENALIKYSTHSSLEHFVGLARDHATSQQKSINRRKDTPARHFSPMAQLRTQTGTPSSR